MASTVAVEGRLSVHRASVVALTALSPVGSNASSWDVVVAAEELVEEVVEVALTPRVGAVDVAAT